MQTNNCVLCTKTGGQLIWKNEYLRVIHTPEIGFPAFYRVVWNQHVAEFSDLNAKNRHYCIDVIVQLEKLLREILAPTKINLASLGNMVPHLHWHIIARFDWDSHFPDAVWASANRSIDQLKTQDLESKLFAVNVKISDFMTGVGL